MKTGTVKTYSDSRGYGLITPDGGGGDIFARFGDIVGPLGFRTLQVGQRVRFNVVVGWDGHHATHIEPIGDVSAKQEATSCFRPEG